MSEELSYLYVPFAHKSKVSPDGSIEVYGKMTGPQLDLDDQIVDADWAREAISEWFKAAANIRQMHSANLPPAGKGLEIKEDEDGFWLRSKIIEPYAIKAIENDVYTGYSIGIKAPRIQRDTSARGGRIVGGTIVETSVVDYPCLSSAKFVKSDERTQSAKFILAERFRDDVAFIGKFAPVEEVEDTRAKLISTTDDLGEEAKPSEPEVEKRDVSSKEPDRPIRRKGRDPEVWYTVKRAHDALCPAYDLADVLFLYPELAKNGLAAALGPGMKGQIFALLDHEVDEDAGTGQEAQGVAQLAKAYKMLCLYLYGEALQVQMDGMPSPYLMEARSDIHKAFTAKYPEQSFHPKGASFTFPAVAGSESGMPAASESFSGSEPSSPGGTASFSPPDAGFMLPSGSDSKNGGGPPAHSTGGSFTDPPVPGSESGMPGGSASLSPNSIPKLADLMSSVHNALAVMGAVDCPLTQLKEAAKTAKAEAKRAKLEQEEPVKTKTEKPENVSEPDVVRKVDLDEIIQRTIKAAELSATKAAEARHDETESDLRRQIESLQTKLDDLAKEPDPKQAVLRKAVGAERPSAANELAEAQLLEKRAEIQNQLEEWRSIYAGSPEFATRDYARRQIERLEAAELLKV